MGYFGSSMDMGGRYRGEVSMGAKFAVSFLTKVATWMILLTISTPAFCEKSVITFSLTFGWLSRTGLMVGYGVTDDFSD